MNDRDRIEYLMNLYQLTPSQFADRTGIQRASVSHILGNRNKPSLEIMLKIYRAFPGVGLEWLITGDGELPVADVTGQNSVNGDSAVVAIPDVQQVIAPSLFPTFMEDVPNKESDAVVPEKVVNKDVRGADAATAAVQMVPKNEEEQAVPSSKEASEALSLKAGGDRRVKEIKVFYDDGTYQTFLPEKL
jgi:transcriptional regulator with XRE-family HTH domain